MELPSPTVFDCGRSMRVGIVGVIGPCSQLLGWKLHYWAVKLSCPKAACPTESCSDRDLQVFPSSMLHRRCLPLNNYPLVSVSLSRWVCTHPLQQEWNLYGLDRAIHDRGKGFPHPFLKLHGSSRRLCFTGGSMASGWHRFQVFKVLGLELQIWGAELS